MFLRISHYFGLLALKTIVNSYEENIDGLQVQNVFCAHYIDFPQCAVYFQLAVTEVGLFHYLSHAL